MVFAEFLAWILTTKLPTNPSGPVHYTAFLWKKKAAIMATLLHSVCTLVVLAGLIQTIASHTQKLPSSSDCICCLNSIRLGCLDPLKTGFKLCCVRGITSRNCLNYYFWRRLQTARTSSLRFNCFFFPSQKTDNNSQNGAQKLWKLAEEVQSCWNERNWVWNRLWVWNGGQLFCWHGNTDHEMN